MKGTVPDIWHYINAFIIIIINTIILHLHPVLRNTNKKGLENLFNFGLIHLYI
jgi:hypothetical protein